MMKLVRQFGIIGPIVIFVVSVTSLTFYQQLMEGPLLIKLAVGVVLLVSLIVSIVPQWRSIQAEEFDANLSRAFTALSTLLGHARVFQDAFELDTNPVYDVAMRIYVERLQDAQVPLRTFFTRDFRDGRIHSYPSTPELHLIDDVDAAFIELGVHDPIILTSPGMFGLDSWPRATIGNLPVAKTVGEPAYRRRLASRRFSGNYCIATTTETEGKFTGFVALVVDRHIENRLFDRFNLLLKQFEELTWRLWLDHLRLRIDDFLNRSYASLVRHGINSVDEFAGVLLQILTDEFALTNTEVWIRGMAQPKTFGGVNYSYRLDIELGDMVLGRIRVGRRNIPLTNNEKQALEVMEDELDNYVRDLWQQSVLRSVDHNVLNKLPRTLQNFLDLLATELVKVFDAESAIVSIGDGKQQGFFSLKEAGGEVVNKRLKDVASGFVATQLAGPQVVDGRYYLSTPISLSSRYLGIQVLEGKKKFSQVEADCAKTLESYIDNIFGLYLQFYEEESQ